MIGVTCLLFYQKDGTLSGGRSPGSVAMTMSAKVFIAHRDTGKIDVPETTSGGKCKITTDTGDIRIEIINKK